MPPDLVDPGARRVGVLLHPTSLPSPHGVGDLGVEAYAFVDWLHAAGATVWQFLPLAPPGRHDSPYDAGHHLAGDPLLIDLRRLADEGLLTRLPAWPADPQRLGDRSAAARFKGPLLRQAAEAVASEPGLRAFRERAPWADAAPGGPALQWLFERQWAALRRHCARRDVLLLGDLPMYVGPSAPDLAARPELWELDAEGRPEAFSGAPPDAFNAEGQWWGAPVYRWPAHAAEGFAWWRARVARALALSDVVRVDHFRGFQAWWRVPAGHDSARHGRWVEGPGEALFAALRADLGAGPLPFVAEDLGDVDASVEDLRLRLGVPGTRVLQFAWDDDPDNVHLPAHHGEDVVAMTGTHDTDTAVGWWSSATGAQRQRFGEALGAEGPAVAWAMIEAVMASPARWAVIPAQDLLGFGSEARMNTPGTTTGNWAWRLRSGELSGDLARRLRALGCAHRRSPAP